MKMSIEIYFTASLKINALLQNILPIFVFLWLDEETEQRNHETKHISKKLKLMKTALIENI